MIQKSTEVTLLPGHITWRIRECYLLITFYCFCKQITVVVKGQQINGILNHLLSLFVVTCISAVRKMRHIAPSKEVGMWLVWIHLPKLGQARGCKTVTSHWWTTQAGVPDHGEAFVALSRQWLGSQAKKVSILWIQGIRRLVVYCNACTVPVGCRLSGCT